MKFDITFKSSVILSHGIGAQGPCDAVCLHLSDTLKLNMYLQNKVLEYICAYAKAFSCDMAKVDLFDIAVCMLDAYVFMLICYCLLYAYYMLMLMLVDARKYFFVGKG